MNMIVLKGEMIDFEAMSPGVRYRFVEGLETLLVSHRDSVFEVDMELKE